ncbi:MAG: hypothetical protein IT376_06205 [Polyangiaceae bacterium]|nr:hypothetical protein [Polyangiaceae bacterium]
MTPTSKSSPLAWLAAALVLVSALVAVVFMQTRLDRELSQLPEPERRALFERARATLRSTCAQASGPEVTKYCRQQADFIKRFPERDSECRELAARLAPQPSR